MPNKNTLHMLDRVAIIAILIGYALIVAGVGLLNIAYSLIVAGLGAILIGFACARFVVASERTARAQPGTAQPSESA